MDKVNSSRDMNSEMNTFPREITMLLLLFQKPTSIAISNFKIIISSA